MKKYFILLIALYSLWINANCQADSSIGDKFKSLQLNSSPAFVIIGVDPENIYRPNSPTDFLANSQSAIVNGRLQPNFALETSPYFWKKMAVKQNTFNILNYLLEKDYFQKLAESFTFSFATSPADTVLFSNLNAGTALGLGIHLQLAQGALGKKNLKNLNSWFYSSRLASIYLYITNKLVRGKDNYIDDLNLFIDKVLSSNTFKLIPEKEKSVLKSLVLQTIKKPSLDATDLSYIRRLIANINNDAEKSLSELNKFKIPLTREGFMLQLSAAIADVAVNDKFDSIRNVKSSIWITPSYRFNVNSDPTLIDFIDIMAVARLTFNNRIVDSSNYIDGGLKLQWIHDRISLSVESVGRYLTKKPAIQMKNYTWRSDLSFSYKLNQFVTFKSSFGTNFDGNSYHYSEPKKLFIVGGFNFGFIPFFKSDNNH
jgi:hypothetical protein